MHKTVIEAVHKNNLRAFIKDKLLLSSQSCKDLGIEDMAVGVETRKDSIIYMKKHGDLMLIELSLWFPDKK